MRGACAWILSVRCLRTSAGSDQRPGEAVVRAVDGCRICHECPCCAADPDHDCCALQPDFVEIQLARLCSYSEECRRFDANTLFDGDRHGARRMRDRQRKYRSVRKDDRDRLPHRRPGRSICDWPRSRLTNCDSHGFERGGFLKSREINAIASRSTHGPRSADPPPVSFLQVVHPVLTEEAEAAEASDFRFQGRTGLTCIKVPG